MRQAKITRTTKETDITLALTLDCSANGVSAGLEGTSGVGFFDHMLGSYAIHSDSRIELCMTGDLHVDCHHSIEDCGIVLGKAYAQILGNKQGIARFGTAFVPMDEALAFASVDISGRPYLVFDAEFRAPMIGDYDCQMTVEFMRALAYNMGATLHMRAEYATNDHHITEALYKAVSRAIAQALEIKGGQILSAKGVL